MRATSTIAEFVAKSRWEDCPAEAVDAARRAILDSLGVMLAGSVEPAARIVTEIARSEGGAPLAKSGLRFRPGDTPRVLGWVVAGLAVVVLALRLLLGRR